MLKQLIIVGGGSGTRMNSVVPKQFLTINNKTILEHTIASFEAIVDLENIILVLPENEISRWEEIVKGHPYAHIRVAKGGSTRFESVQSGLKLVLKKGVVGIHDAVRPFASIQTIETAFQSAEKRGSGIPAIALSSSIRRVFEGLSRAESRENFKLIQTPQCFRYSQLKTAYQQPFKEQFTDDASVVEVAGFKVVLTEGNQENIKITTPFDLKVAELLVSN